MEVHKAENSCHMILNPTPGHISEQNSIDLTIYMFAAALFVIVGARNKCSWTDKS